MKDDPIFEPPDSVEASTQDGRVPPPDDPAEDDDSASQADLGPPNRPDADPYQPL